MEIVAEVQNFAHAISELPFLLVGIGLLVSGFLVTVKTFGEVKIQKRL